MRQGPWCALTDHVIAYMTIAVRLESSIVRSLKGRKMGMSNKGIERWVVPLMRGPWSGRAKRSSWFRLPRAGIVTTHLGHSILIGGRAATTTSRLRRYGNFLEQVIPCLFLCFRSISLLSILWVRIKSCRARRAFLCSKKLSSMGTEARRTIDNSAFLLGIEVTLEWYLPG